MDGSPSRRDVLRVAVLMGGQSAEREVSLKTGETVVSKLRGRYRVKPVTILASGLWIVPEGYLEAPAGLAGIEPGARSQGRDRAGPAPLRGSIVEALRELEREQVDVVFNALHGPLGEDGTVQGLFRMVGIPLTGPDVIPAAVTMDKRLTKQVLVAAGVPTPRFFHFPASSVCGSSVGWREALALQAERIPFPWIVKPNRLGSSVGVAMYPDLDRVLAGLPDLLASWPELAYDDNVLVEEVVRGRELSCPVVETSGSPRPLPPIEIRPRGRAFFDYHAKYVPGASEEICPAPITAAETELVEETAVRVHTLLECAPLSRTDLFLTPEGGTQILEVNTLPGMTATSLVPLAARVAGMTLEYLLTEIVEHAMRRGRRILAAATGASEDVTVEAVERLEETVAAAGHSQEGTGA